MTNISDLFGDTSADNLGDIPGVTYLYAGDDGFEDALRALFGEDADLEAEIEAVLADVQDDEVVEGEPVVGEFLTQADQDSLAVVGVLGAAVGALVDGRTYTPRELFDVAVRYAERMEIPQDHFTWEVIAEYRHVFDEHEGSV